MRGMRLGPNGRRLLLGLLLAVAVARVFGGPGAAPLPVVHHASAPAGPALPQTGTGG